MRIAKPSIHCNLKYIDEQNRNKDIDIENGLEDTGGRGSWDEVREWHRHIYTTKCKIDS